MLRDDFVDYSARKLGQYLERIEVCLGRLNDDQIWSRGHESENSIGNLCLHLAGNVRQWILCGIGGEEDHRQRDAEFAAAGGHDRDELLGDLRATVEQACVLIRTLTSERLEERVTIQNYPVTVLEGVYHVVEHFSHHAGQILFATKAMLGEHLGFYRHLSQDEHDETTP